MTKTFVLKQEQASNNFQVDYKKALNEEQYEVVTKGEGPCLVLAGAGSGKTRTITYRVAYLIENGVNPENILLVTFTNKAAKEMLQRVEGLLKAYPDKLWGGTFHSIGNRLLRKYAKAIGYENNFTILDEEDSKDLLKVCIKDAGIDAKARRFPSAAVIKDIISYAKNSQTKMADVIELKHPKWSEIEEQIGRVASLYEQKKKEANSMDFDDLLFNWLKLLKDNPQIKKALATQFKYILVDEYQDTNYIQAAIIKELSEVNQNVLVVGDDAQSIYSFRAADIGNILKFTDDYPKAKIFKLETNYRSTPEILSVANQVIENNTKQYPKVLKPIIQSYVKPNLVPSFSAAQEAEFISQQILLLREEGLPLNKMAVLFRAAYHSQELEFQLTKKDIPYDYRGGVRFFERAHIKDVIAFLKILSNPKDEVAWLRLLTKQEGIGEVMAGKIYQAVKDLDCPIACFKEDLSGVLTAKAQIGWQRLTSIYLKDLEVEKLKDLDDPADFIRKIMKSDYQDYLAAEYTNWQERIDDINQLALFAERYDDVKSFLAEITLQETYNVEHGQPENSDEEKIVLTTIHQAKGLEWEAVFVMNLVDTAFPNQRALNEIEGLEEERRLFYVATTRAQRQLFLTYPLVSGYTTGINSPSRFLNEVDPKLLEEVKLIEDKKDYSRLNDEVSDVEYLPDLNDF